MVRRRLRFALFGLVLNGLWPEQTQANIIFFCSPSFYFIFFYSICCCTVLPMCSADTFLFFLSYDKWKLIIKEDKITWYNYMYWDTSVRLCVRLHLFCYSSWIRQLQNAFACASRWLIFFSFSSIKFKIFIE